MKLERLHLKAFGGFDDHALDLSGGDAGLHLIYGPNEAGKSTTLRAITQLFYGIPIRTADDFLHPMKSLRIGATVGRGKDSLTFYRRKGKSSTLLAADEKAPLSDDALFAFLGGVDEETFSHLFGLSHEQLVRGGEALVQGEGDVGQALFSAAAGMGNLRNVLDHLEAEAGDLFKPSGSKPSINHALSALRDGNKQLREVQLLPKEWTALSEALELARGERDGLVAQIRELSTAQRHGERILKALPLVAQRLETLERLRELGDGVSLPEDFRERRVSAVQGLAVAREQHQVAESNLARLVAQLDALDVDETLLAQESRIEALHGTHEVILKAQHDKQRNLEPELRAHQAEMARLLKELKCDVSRDALEGLRPEPGVAARIAELRSTRQHLQQEKEHVGTQQQKLEAERNRCVEGLATLGELPDAGPLTRVLQEAMAVAAREQEHQRQVDATAQLGQQVDDAIERLDYWSGSREALESLKVPKASTIERLRVQLESDEAEAQRWTQEKETLEKERDELTIQLNGLQRAQHIPTEGELLALREQRATGWRYARDAWTDGIRPDAVDKAPVKAFLKTVGTTGNLADAVETLIQEGDDISDRLRRESDRSAQVAQLESRRDALAERLTRVSANQAAGQTRHDATRAEWHGLWAPAGIEPESPLEMAEWYGDYRAILDDLARLKTEEAQVVAYRALAAQQKEALVTALDALGHRPSHTSLDLSGWVGEGETFLGALREQQEQQARWKNQLELAEKELAELARTQSQNEENQTAWASEWADMMGRIGAGATISPTEATAKLERLTTLFDTLDDADALEQRIAQMDEDHGAYLADVEELAQAASTLTDHPLDSLVPALFQLLKAHREMATEQRGLLRRREEEAAALATSEAALERAESELSDLCALAQVDSVVALEEAEGRSLKGAALHHELDGLEARLLDISPGLSLEAFLDAVASEDPDQVEARLATMGPELARAEEKRESLSETIGKQEGELNKLDGSGEAAALADDAENLLAEVREDAQRYAQLKVAHYVLSEAIERYRTANQDPLLARAGALFEILTLGSFKELRADVDDRGRQVLCGVRARNDALVHVGGMSEGSADQLYLALRLASLERHLEKHDPIPFVLDDILVNFDDQRAAATLKVLGELSKKTQVIYFTHHHHLVTLAKEHVEGSCLYTHELPRD